MNREELESQLNYFVGRDEYENALAAFEEAERQGLDIHPCDFYIKGKFLAILGRNKEALQAFEWVEIHCGKRHPDFYLDVAIVFEHLGRLEEAVISYQQVEIINGGKHYKASYNKAFLLRKLGRLEEALAAFKKSEIDKDGINPHASFNVGYVLAMLGRKQEAIDSYEYTEKTSEKYANASLNKAMLLAELGRNEEAIASYSKAETDSDYGKFPSASYCKGLVLQDMGRYEEAIEAYTKAELDSGGKFPDASCNRGNTLASLDRYEESIAAYTKAENDNGGKHYNATQNKGISHYLSGKLELAAKCFYIIIEDIDDRHHPMAHFFLARIYLETDNQKAKHHAFSAINLSSRSGKIVEFIFKNFSNLNTSGFYKNRLDYIDLQFEVAMAAKLKSKAEDNQDLFERLFENSFTEELHAMDSFQALLKTPYVQFPTSISMRERLRLAYLTHFMEKQSHHTFYMIDSVIDGEYELEGIDYFFYVAAAYLIGEPIDELKYFIDNVELAADDPFYKDFNSLRETFANAIQNNQKFDPYLLNPGSIDFIPAESTLQKLQAHPWVQNALRAIVQSTPYEIPVPTSVLKGMATQLLADSFDQQNTEEFASNRTWKNVLRNLKDEIIEYKDLIGNIRDAIREKVPHSLILAKLFQEFDAEQDENKKHNLAVVQAAVLISYHVDYLKRSLNKHSYLEVPTESFFEVSIEKMIELGVTLTFFSTWGIGIALGLSKNAIKSRYLKNMQTKKDEIFEELINQIR